VLVGRAIDFLPYIIYVLDGAGREGIGRRRVPYRLLCVTDGSRDGGGAVFRAEDKILRDEFSALRLEDMEREGDDQIRQVCLQLLTPLRVKKYDGYQDSGERITFATLGRLPPGVSGGTEPLSLRRRLGPRQGVA
jgi:hypothetical protein